MFILSSLRGVFYWGGGGARGRKLMKFREDYVLSLCQRETMFIMYSRCDVNFEMFVKK